MGSLAQHKITASTLQVEINTLTIQKEAMQERLEQVADFLIRYKVIDDTPYERHRFVTGCAMNHFPKTSAEFEDTDGQQSSA